MFAATYLSQAYFGQGYPITGAIVYGRYGIDVYGTDGSLVVRLGDIGGMIWGGSNFVLPEGTFGLWGKRDGLWDKGTVQMFYANGSNLSITFSVVEPNPGNVLNTAGLFQVDIDETFPFGSIIVPGGRMVTWEDFLYFGLVSVVSTDLPGALSVAVNASSIANTKFLASKDGGTLSVWNYLSGPDGTKDLTTYTNIRLRRRYLIQTSLNRASGINQNITWTLTVRRVSTLRLFSHEANAAPNLAASFVSYVEGGTTSADSNKGEDRVPGGTGIEPGGYAGTPGGGGALA
jgi:hypothetical protein